MSSVNNIFFNSLKVLLERYTWIQVQVDLLSLTGSSRMEAKL